MASRKTPEINAGSMADIAFLLLVFFLVTTTIQTDAGVQTTLPPWIPNDSKLETPIERQNLFAIQINGRDEILMRERPVKADEIKPTLIEFITNYNRRPDYSENPKVAVVSLLNDKSTSYAMYLTVYNEVKAAYNAVWDSYATQNFGGRKYAELTEPEQDSVRSVFPLNISEAEPSDHSTGGN